MDKSQLVGDQTGKTSHIWGFPYVHLLRLLRRGSPHFLRGFFLGSETRPSIGEALARDAFQGNVGALGILDSAS